MNEEKRKKSEKYKLSVSVLSEAPTIAQGQRRGRTGRNISLCLFLSLSVFLWRQGERVGQVEVLPWGQTGCACMCLYACE